MKRCYAILFILIMSLFLLQIFLAVGFCIEKDDTTQSELVQAKVVLTVSESKRLIAKAVAQMPIVKNALEKGIVIITKGTTNTYVAEEILGRKIERGAYVLGKVYPAKGGKKLKSSTRIPEFVIKDGKVIEDLSLADAVKELNPGDVVIKGANALDYKNKTAGVYIGSPSAGTAGTIMPYVVARRAHLIVPVGLEKLIAGDVLEIANKMREPIEEINRVPSMFLLTGEIVTEIEAVRILTGVEAFQAGAGGIGGAEGSVFLVLRGTEDNVERALEFIQGIQGESQFVE